MMMMKIWTSTSRSVLNVAKVGPPLGAVISSHGYAQGIQHNVGAPNPRNMDSRNTPNNIDAPFAGTEPKVTRKMIVEDHNDVGHDNKRDDWKKDTEDMTSYVADKAKGGTRSAVETVFKVGETVAEGMEKSWGGVKETTQKIKETVLGEKDEEHPGGDGRRKEDEHVEDLRRKAGGYDRKFH